MSPHSAEPVPGQTLQAAQEWAADKNLGQQDNQFLSASQNLENRSLRESFRLLEEAREKAEQALAEEKEARQKLQEIRQKTLRTMGIGLFGLATISGVGVSLVLMTKTLTQTPPIVSQRITMYSKPAVVKIVSICSAVYQDNRDPEQPKEIPFISGWNRVDAPTVKNAENDLALGSGFLIGSDGYIVTNAHVVNGATDEKGEAYCIAKLRRNLEEKLKLTKENVTTLIDTQQITEKIRYSQDVLLPNSSNDAKVEKFPFDVKQRGTAKGSGGMDVAVIKIEVMNAPILRLADSGLAGLQDPIIVIGYPGGADVASAQEQDAASLVEATTSEGTVSNPNKVLSDRSSLIQVDVAVGSAGSPVLNQNGDVIGMISFQSNDNQVNNRPFAIPVATIQGFVRASGAVNERGPTDFLYSEGLNLYWGSEFEGAKKKFEAVTSLFLPHSEAQRLIRETNEKIAKSVGRQANIIWLVGVGGVAVSIALGLLGYASLNNRLEQ